MPGVEKKCIWMERVSIPAYQLPNTFELKLLKLVVARRSMPKIVLKNLVKRGAAGAIRKVFNWILSPQNPPTCVLKKPREGEKKPRKGEKSRVRARSRLGAGFDKFC